MTLPSVSATAGPQSVQQRALPRQSNSPVSKPASVSVSPVPSALTGFHDEKLAAWTNTRSPLIHFKPGTVSTPAISTPDQTPADTEPVSHRTPAQLPDATPQDDPVANRQRQIAQRALAEQRRATERHLQTMTRVLGQACVEIEYGLRSYHQLQGWMSLEMIEKMRFRAQLAQQGRPQESDGQKPMNVRVHRMRLQRTPSQCYESSATIIVGNRLRAMALRFEKHRDRWKVCDFELG
ncbi:MULTISPECIES: Rv3235 family protein [Auritidibacter]|uniref:Rv3235 family protein n=1 Tax=Auritidibacter TaxID=1160973 RepID=UPI000D72866A|nr:MULTISPECIES: Rv3235 family protein [Auritidibacter]NIH71628.1 hypothetical protein [Auritidibacter ignavus]PXA77451.1 hypothetical protein DCC24_03850 [Auritidibacter sp. NML100628]PXA81928.1 hypothetical protein DCC25_00660 [Auritidibacter sp. NML120636]RMX24225.1 hypothetical protein DYI20_01270 [Auritidibacter ignavus]WGH81722.1 Rv3235 family protein [Auritidibacter ignavus]